MKDRKSGEGSSGHLGRDRHKTLFEIPSQKIAKESAHYEKGIFEIPFFDQTRDNSGGLNFNPLNSNTNPVVNPLNPTGLNNQLINQTFNPVNSLNNLNNFSHNLNNNFNNINNFNDGLSGINFGGNSFGGDNNLNNNYNNSFNNNSFGAQNFGVNINNFKNSANFGDYLGAVDIWQFINIYKNNFNNNNFTINFTDSTILGLKNTNLILPELIPGLIPDLDKNNINNDSKTVENNVKNNVNNSPPNLTPNNFNVNFDPTDKINELAAKCCTTAKNTALLFHGSICKLSPNECSFKNCANMRKDASHIRNCKLKKCNILNSNGNSNENDCVMTRSVLKHFCECSKEDCYFCRLLFHEVDNIIDTTNYDHSKFNKKPHHPAVQSDIIDYFFDCYLKFYARIMPSFDMIPGFNRELRSKEPPLFFIDSPDLENDIKNDENLNLTNNDNIKSSVNNDVNDINIDNSLNFTIKNTQNIDNSLKNTLNNESLVINQDMGTSEMILNEIRGEGADLGTDKVIELQNNLQKNTTNNERKRVKTMNSEESTGNSSGEFFDSREINENSKNYNTNSTNNDMNKNKFSKNPGISDDSAGGSSGDSGENSGVNSLRNSGGNSTTKSTTENLETNISINNELENPVLICQKYQEILKKLMALPEAIYFNQPVDPVKLEIPDYFEIIHEPMDFSTILIKLQNLEYSTHWDIIYDMNLVFDNAYMYNKRVTRVHKCAVKLASIFNNQTVHTMSKLGYCCNRRLVYSPQILYCLSSDFCIIPIGAYYYRYDEKILYCLTCFDKFKSNVVECHYDENDIRQIPKENFAKTRNNLTVYEPFVSCEICHRKNHKVCVMHVESINGVFWYCNSCRNNSNLNTSNSSSKSSNNATIPIIENKFTSNNLPVTVLSEFIENRVNSFLISECKDCQYVRIRVICNVEKSLAVNQGLLNRFPGCLPEKFPYKAKALFAFQEISKTEEVCFFSMHVQEYGRDCPEPNTRRMNLSYIDSVHYFRPKHLKTRLYHEILLSYLAYCKTMGFWYCHIWSCPSAEGFDYVFHCHSYEQKLPKPRRLLEWYIKMIELGVQNKIIIEYKDIYKYFENYTKELAVAIPYFDGDYWSNSLEDLINEHEKERLSISEFTSGAADISSYVPAKKKGSKQKKTTSKKTTNGEQTLNQKLMTVMDKYREVFFIIKLNECDVPFYDDTDPIFQSDLMDGRSGFLALCRENNWEFSSFRHAQYSTKAMMYVVHQQMFNFVEFTCDKCKAVLVTGYHCEICPADFDLCLICKTRFGHQHELKLRTYIEFKLGANIRGDSSLKNIFGELTYSKDNFNELFIKTVIHVLSCKNSLSCKVTVCRAIKSLLDHYNSCYKNDRSKCEICFGIFKMYSYHAKHCTSQSCELPTCSRIKDMLKPTRGVANKKIQSRINKMNNQLKEEKNQSQTEASIIHRPKKYHVPPDSDENSLKTVQNPSLLNDPLFAIPPSNVPVNYSLGSLKPSATASVTSVKPTGTVERKTSSQATSRRSRKTDTPQLIQYDTPQFDTNNMPGVMAGTMINNMGGFRPGFNHQPMIIMNQGMRFPNNMEPMMTRSPIMNFDPNRQNDMMNLLNVNDQGRQSYHSPVNQSSLNSGFQGTGSQNPTPTPLMCRSLSSSEIKQSSPMMNQSQINIDPNKQFQNSAPSRMGQPIGGQQIVQPQGGLNNEMVRISGNYNPNISMIQNDFTGNTNLQGNVRQNNPNYILQTMPMNQETGIIDHNNISYLPNGTIIVNSPQSSLNQLSFLTLQQAMQCQNLGVRPQNIVINGAEKQVIPNQTIRGNQVQGINMMNMQANQNIIMRPAMRPGMNMNINQMNQSGYIQLPQIQNINNVNNPRPPNIQNPQFNMQSGVRIRPNIPQNPNPR